MHYLPHRNNLFKKIEIKISYCTQLCKLNQVYSALKWGENSTIIKMPS